MQYIANGDIPKRYGTCNDINSYENECLKQFSQLNENTCKKNLAV